MAAELTSTKLNAENHLLLDQPLLRVPHELARRNFKSVQRLVEREREYVLPALKEAANASLANTQTPDQTLAALDAMISRMQGLKRKMESLQEEEKRIQEQSRKRIQHLECLHQIPSLADVKYDQWSRVRLDRLVIDHMLRSGYTASAQQLAQEKGIVDLVDLDVFTQCQRIAQSLRHGETRDALQWCNENKAALKKSRFNLEFELRLQQYIEIIRTGDRGRFIDAMAHAKRYLTPYIETQSMEIHRAAGLLAFPRDTKADPYKSMYSSDRWTYLSDLFIRTHHELLSLSSRPLLHIALSAGLSALKTPSCHSEYTSPSSNSLSTTTSVCPICSTELKELARNMPYAHHAKSYVENDPIILPNGRIYGQQRLLDMSKKVGCVETGKVKDPTTGEIFDESEMKKVYIM
ncbi:FYV10 family protein [Aspergillus clavatus NRRL 1]|uniref:Protein fyv10 n=1 Tax=Aspergillus clavatus (strain ATCC 1007 / CBS 513.65 / DSM 816 / NCTC 3887 / NRRL 1 / QM 1276 / 107) TaxID=344612 RepID=FYV10_ASPCL|nr:negative regulation of gluconeogenesis, putative [Aspergillus clavatus NRRL 1]A1C9R2.1 RecName: Full=Protein fyv10 [Aspergillus clavatus NRRL 1]EAW12480.1 negative regulation of gluconeogenesis, putative [Aspergillus clavatus NRRL 1]